MSFTPALFQFLRELAANNSRDWFEANRDRYRDDVQEPSLAFVAAMGPLLESVSPSFRAIPKKSGGSLFRIHRDVRFSADKSPYKTHVGIRFPHARGKDVHTPGFYVHLQPDECFAGMGIWHPDSKTLGKLRTAMVEDPRGWIAARDDAGLRRELTFGGDSLTRAPRGFAADHELIEDLKRKDVLVYAPISEDDVVDPDFPLRVTELFAAGYPVVRWLCRALELEA